MRYFATGTWLLLAARACSTDGGGSAHSGPDGPALHTELDDLCDAVCERATRCPEEEDPGSDAATCRSACAKELPEPEWLRGDIVRGLAQCQRQLACNESDDQCLEQVLQRLVPGYDSSPLLQLCLDVQDRCGGFSDDECSYTVTFVDGGKEHLRDCLNSTCERVRTCLDGLKPQM